VADAPDPDLRARREALVLEHVAGENERDLERVMRTFARPRYEIVPTGVVVDGDEAVRAFLLAQWASLPPVTYHALAVFHGPDALVVETRTVGRRADGIPIDMTSVNLFGFEGEGLVLERCWFDQVTVARQLGLGDAPSG
jgi:hypothetical protein